VLVNESADDNHWLRVRLVGTRFHRDAVGARLTLTPSIGVQTRQIKGRGCYLSQSDLAAYFGVPKRSRIEKLLVDWPSGIRQEFTDIQPDQAVTCIEP
jgi:hypothetical protein